MTNQLSPSSYVFSPKGEKEFGAKVDAYGLGKFRGGHLTCESIRRLIGIRDNKERHLKFCRPETYRVLTEKRPPLAGQYPEGETLHA